VDQHCPAAVDTLPVSIDNITIVNREQVDAYCNGFSDGEQALASHPGVRSHVSSSMVLPHNATGFSNTIKIMPNGSAAEIGHPRIINQTHSAPLRFNMTVGEHDSYPQGYNQGIHDWNMFAQDLNHHFICPYNDTSAFCFGYDVALWFETSDQ
jgi:hypothetical protein